jgi:hypothetical protein
MPAGYSKTPLLKKLGIKQDFKILLINQPHNLLELLGPLPENTEIVQNAGKGEIDYIHFFIKDQNEFLGKMDELKSKLKKNGLMWVSWPKKASKVPTTVDESLVRKTGLESGLVDVKICAVDEIWSGLKFVYRVKDR